jgi:hypothetical protein
MREPLFGIRRIRLQDGVDKTCMDVIYLLGYLSQSLSHIQVTDTISLSEAGDPFLPDVAGDCFFFFAATNAMHNGSCTLPRHPRLRRWGS